MEKRIEDIRAIRDRLNINYAGNGKASFVVLAEKEDDHINISQTYGGTSGVLLSAVAETLGEAIAVIANANTSETLDGILMDFKRELSKAAHTKWEKQTGKKSIMAVLD